jgi:hypothetical protein
MLAFIFFTFLINCNKWMIKADGRLAGAGCVIYTPVLLILLNLMLFWYH